MFEDKDKNPDDGGRDLSAVFDLDRSKLTGSMVDRMENVMRDADRARDDLKQVVSECREANFVPRDIEAMKKIAKLRLKDQRGRAREQIDALRRIGKAVQFDLFD